MPPLPIIIVNYGVPLFTHLRSKSSSYQLHPLSHRARLSNTPRHTEQRTARVYEMPGCYASSKPLQQYRPGNGESPARCCLALLYLQGYPGVRVPSLSRYVETELFNHAHLGHTRP